MIENEKRTVWVVSYYDYNNLPVVTVFSNKDAASLYYNYELKKNKHEKIDIDQCPIYSTFYVKNIQ